MNPLFSFLYLWLGCGVTGLALLLYYSFDAVNTNLKETPWTTLGILLLMLLAGSVSLMACILTVFYVPALEHSRERTIKLAKEREAERKANERWVQLELFEDLE